MIRMLHRYAVLLLLALSVAPLAQAQATPEIGIVVMHGKGGSPTRLVTDLAAGLEERGYLVANLEMPWSKRRDYDVPVSVAEREVVAALDGLRARGARTLFVAGHSQGGLFALYFAGRQAVAGIVAIAPGANVANAIFRDKLGAAVAQARQLVAAGRGGERAQFLDYENAKGSYPVNATAADYLSWFDPEGAMNQTTAIGNIKPGTPVLYIVPTRDYPGMQRVKQTMFDALPRHPLTRLYEPDATHTGAPTASLDEIQRWTAEVSRTPAR
jgi:pimeloyl-ACP methyl ester carboxylesterase